MTDTEYKLPPSIRFTVYGIAQPAGSKRSMAVRRKGGALVLGKRGQPIINTVDANPKAGDWKKIVAQVAGESYKGPLLQGPLCLELTFHMPRPKGHYGTGKKASILRASSPKHHTQKPDATKLTRGVEDALTGVIWNDDTQVVSQFVQKIWTMDQARVDVAVRVLT